MVISNNGVLTRAFRTLQSRTLHSFPRMPLDTASGGEAADVTLYPRLTTLGESRRNYLRLRPGFRLADRLHDYEGIVEPKRQSVAKRSGLDSWISGIHASVAGALVSPGLYQFNIRIPNGAPGAITQGTASIPRLRRSRRTPGSSAVLAGNRLWVWIDFN